MSETKALGLQILTAVKSKLADGWNSFSDAEKTLVQACCEDAAYIAVRSIAGESVASEKAQIDAQLANIKVAGKAVVSKTIWNVVVDLLSLAAKILVR